MGSLLRHFLVDDSGQDLTEYALLLAFVVLASAGILLQSSGSYIGIWSTTNSNLALGAQRASN